MVVRNHENYENEQKAAQEAAEAAKRKATEKATEKKAGKKQKAAKGEDQAEEAAPVEKESIQEQKVSSTASAISTGSAEPKKKEL